MDSMKKVLFVDFDGVLNNSLMWNLYGAFGMDSQSDYLSPKLVSKLNTIVETTNCGIVISSAWRNEYSLDDLKKFLINNNFKYPNNIIGVTPKTLLGHRGNEIAEWLKSNGELLVYAIVDDVQFNIEEMHPGKFVRTNSDYGLTHNDVEKIINILN
jgi:uncharacterized protein (DUF1499 family)